MAATPGANPPGHAPACVFLDDATLRSFLPLRALIPHLQSSLPSLSLSVHSPPRHSHAIDASTSSTLLLMPSWSSHPSLPFIGVKLVTSFPFNSNLHLPGIHASFLLFSSSTGVPLASIDATPLTLLRTSAVSALASLHLSRPASSVLVLAGAGALAPYLVRAHLISRPSINRVIIWNRNPEKARDLVLELRREFDHGVAFDYADDLDQVVGLGDIVSCATSSVTPLVRGELLKSGAHLDLVGSFTPAMKECDDAAVARGRVFVDFNVALEEAGELVGAFERGVMAPSDVAGTLVELLDGVKEGRRDEEEVTVFKSVGAAVVDLLAAQLAYQTYIAST